MATERAKHAFGTLEKIDQALSNGTIDAYDILFVKDANGKPFVGWIDKEGQKVICDDSAEFAELEGQIATKANAKDVTNLEVEVGKKANAEDVAVKYEEVKYEIADVPVGTLVKINDSEIRIMCPKDSVFTKQAVGSGGNPNCYYATFKTYVYDDKIVGYKEHLGDQVDEEILTDLQTDKYGRRYQPSWLALAQYDEATDTWTYYGAASTGNKYIGWDYRIDWYDANGVIIASDSIRINLSNEDCHSNIEPYYMSSMSEIDAKIEEKVAEVNTGYEIIEF